MKKQILFYLMNYNKKNVLGQRTSVRCSYLYYRRLYEDQYI
ncbi:hypothetical protein C809_00431 [Lachnospiraceae bacterium MD335]|jgi:hypothetical protein|nr:hypothetical protein C809_00431 [Lachnospiraceae bacterium MD335]